MFDEYKIISANAAAQRVFKVSKEIFVSRNNVMRPCSRNCQARKMTSDIEAISCVVCLTADC